MAIASNTFLTYSAKGIREDLSNVIYNISPEETPFVSNIGKGSIANTLFDWQTDALAAASANAQLEGDETSYDAVAATVRLQNYAQISRKSVVISGTEETVNKAGRKSEIAYQIAKKGSEMKRDIEFSCLNNQAAVAGDSTTARTTASLQAFLKTNTNKAGDGTDPVYTTIPTDPRNDGTQRAFTEAILKDVIQQVWTEGGTPKMLLVGPVNKAKVSAFAGIAASRFNVDGAKPSTIIAAADIYVSDFGNVSIVPSRFQRERDAFILDGEYASIDYLRPMQTVDMAKTGDAEKKLLLCEWALRIHTEVAHGGAFDLTTS
jgi:hypothetical protein|tara:strand:- start:2855 stop:3811 length:957 start_codon:yes stop_codon:yes gene_type:complete